MGVRTIYECDVDNVEIVDGKFEQFQAGKRTLIICEEHLINDPSTVKTLIASETETLVDERKSVKDAEIAKELEAIEDLEEK